MFPFAFTTKLVLPTPAPLNSPPIQPQQQQQPQQYFNSGNSSSNSLPQKQQQQSQAANNSVHDTLTDLDEAISELSGANKSQPLQSAIPNVLNWQPNDVRNYFLSLGYEPAVCDCFLQHQITGPILLELDLAYLKEIDIPSFGTRFQISKAIKALNQSLNTGVVQDIPSSLSPSANASQQSLSHTNPENNNHSNNSNNNSNSNSNSNIAKTNSFKENPDSKNNRTEANPVPVFKRQSLLRTAKDNSLLNHHLAKTPAQDYQQHKNNGMHDFPLDNNNSGSFSNPHKKDASFDRSWTVNKGKKASETSQKPTPNKQHQRLRSTTISTTDQYFHENPSSTDSNPLPPFNLSVDKSSNLTFTNDKQTLTSQEPNKQHPSSHTRQLSSDTVRVTNNNPSLSNATSNDGSTLYLPSHNHKPSTSSLGFSDFRYLNKLTSDEAFNDDFAAAAVTSTHQRRPSSLVSVILTGENSEGLQSQKEKSAGESAVDLDSGDESEETKAKRIATDSNTSNSSFDSSNTVQSNSQSQKEGAAITPTNSLGKKKKGSLRGSSSHSNLRKSSSKKTRTSAFQEGIKSVTPTEASKTADYSGWMNKRGSATVGTWKARYFTLHGTRLSYFSQFSDTREKGLIDITSHRVIPVGDEDKLVAMYAASVGAGRHCFKIIPPSPGSRKGVTFTVPKVHYFAVDTKEEMREWINAIIKATIDRDDSVPVVSSCATPTVSLARAREMFAESKAKEEELRTKAKNSNAHNSQMALGSSLTGNNGVSALDAPDSAPIGASTSVGNSSTTPNWLSNFGSNFYHADDGSNGGSSGSLPKGIKGNGLLNGASSLESSIHSGSSKSLDTSSLQDSSSTGNKSQHQKTHGSGALGSLGQGFGSGSLGINPATLSGGSLPSNGAHSAVNADRKRDDIDPLSKKTGGLRLVTEFD